MLDSLRHAGIGFPNGPADNAAIIALPSPRVLLLNSEHWHHDQLVRAGKAVLWRAMARDGRKPAQAKWSPSRYVDEVLRHVDEVDEPVRAFVAWNELDLNYERGDGEDDFADLDRRYGLLGSFQYEVIKQLRTKLASAELHFGAWTPTRDHRAGEYVGHWREAAWACDVIDFHAYLSLDLIAAEYRLYRGLFPDKRLALTEWHCKGDLAEERRVLGWLAETMAEDPLFDAAYFFIWRWDDAPEPWEAYDIEHNPERRALFLAPPVYQEPAPVPTPDYPKLTRDTALLLGLDPDRFERQISVESMGFRPSVIECRLDSPAGARGIAQLMPVHWSTVDPCDPQAALAYAAGLMRDHRRYWLERGYAGDAADALALASYNAGRQATIDGLAGKKKNWPFAETVTYVSKILPCTMEQARAYLTGATVEPPKMIKLSDVLARGRSRIGDPYVWDGEQPGGFDCSGFVKWCYEGTLTSYTDSILGETTRVETPAPGDIVLYEYFDPGQPTTRFPHVGLFISDTVTLDARFGMGVGEHDQLSRAKATRYYRRAPRVEVDTVGPTPAPPPPTPPAPGDDADALRTKLGYVTGDVAAALQQEADIIRASLDALQAALNTLRAHGPA